MHVLAGAGAGREAGATGTVENYSTLYKAAITPRTFTVVGSFLKYTAENLQKLHTYEFVRVRMPGIGKTPPQSLVV